jgi:transposase
MNREALSRLSQDELIDIVLAQARQIETLAARVGELEARLGQPPKTPDNSSLPPSRGAKANKPERPRGLRREASIGRAGGGRPLHPDPDRIVEAWAKVCPRCASGLEAVTQKPVAVYDKIELPPVRPVVTRVRLHGGRCPRLARRW